MTPERIIGKDNDLPWHLPEDLKFFKRTTSGHPIVMGRKTWDSIGRALPKRQNIVITRDENWQAEGATGVDVIHTPEQLREMELMHEDVYIIGGAQIYSVFLPHLDEILVSHVYEKHEGDTKFPEFEHLFENSEVLEKHDDFEVRRYFK